MLGTDKAETTADVETNPPAEAQPPKTLDDQARPGSENDEVGKVPLGKRVKSVAPPLKPFRKGSRMATPPSPSYRPEIPRKVVDIPNPSRLQAERLESVGESDSNRLVVGKSISVSGDISACETLVVHGTVEANRTDAVTLEVADGGLFKGVAEVDRAVISGTFDGTLKARETLEVASSGHVKGTIYYSDITIATGGRVQGTIDSIDASDE